MMKKILIILILFLGCTDAKTKITKRQDEILKQKNLVEQMLQSTQDSAVPSPDQFRVWDSLYDVQDRLNTEYDSLKKELEKLK